MEGYNLQFYENSELGPQLLDNPSSGPDIRAVLNGRPTTKIVLKCEKLFFSVPIFNFLKILSLDLNC